MHPSSGDLPFLICRAKRRAVSSPPPLLLPWKAASRYKQLKKIQLLALVLGGAHNIELFFFFGIDLVLR